MNITRQSHPNLFEEMLEHGDLENQEFVKGSIYECNVVVQLSEDYERCPKEMWDKLYMSNLTHADINYGLIDGGEVVEFIPAKEVEITSYTYEPINT